MNRTILSLLKLIQTLTKEISCDYSYLITDRSTVLFYQPNKEIDLKLSPGDQVPKSTVTYKVLETGAIISEYRQTNTGIFYHAVGVPLYNEREEIEGCITVISTKNNQNKILFVKKEDYWIPLQYDEIVFIEAQNGITFIKTIQDKYMIRKALSHFEKILTAEQFIRCHRSFIININFIERIYPDFHSTFCLVMKDQQRSQIPISQRYASQFRRLFNL